MLFVCCACMQYLASMVDILAGCKRNSLHPQLNGFNLVLTNAGGVDDFGDLMNPAVKLAGLEHCTYTSGRNACYVQDVMVSDIPAGNSDLNSSQHGLLASAPLSGRASAVCHVHARQEADWRQSRVCSHANRPGLAAACRNTCQLCGVLAQ